MDLSFQTWLSVALGIGLAAAAGFRVFLPFLVAGLAARAGWIPLADGFAWLASTPALVTLGTAAAAEALAYAVPGLDHLLDLVAGPAAIAAGVVASAAAMADVPPAVLWPVAVIAGGGVAALTKGSAAVVRAHSGVLTGGLANPLVSTVETVGATALAVLAVALPLVAVVAVAGLAVWAARKTGRWLFSRRSKA